MGKKWTVSMGGRLGLVESLFEDSVAKLLFIPLLLLFFFFFGLMVPLFLLSLNVIIVVSV